MEESARPQTEAEAKPKNRSHMKYETNCSNFPKGAKAHM